MEEKEIMFEEFNKDDAIKLKRLLSSFIKSYANKSESVKDEEWLGLEFRKELPDYTDDEIKKLVKECVESIQEFDDNLKSVNDEAKNGKSKEQWLASKIAQAETGVSVIQYGEYLNSINDSLTNANAQMLRTITTKSGEISRSYNLDGFIAEQFHVNTFNANAALAKSKFIAEVKVPEAGKTYGKNSVDIVIRNRTNSKLTPVHQYQVKYGKNASETIKMLREHGDVTKYSNQQIVVPPDQLLEVQKAFPGKTIVSQIGGTDKVSITSNKLTKQSAKELQVISQELEAVPTMDWNSLQTKNLALQIGKNAGFMGLQAAAISTGFSLVEQIVKGEGIDTEETVALALETGADAGLKTAITGALHVGVQRDIIRIIPKGTPIGVIANIVCVGIENIKILSKVAKGEITMSEALEQMGRTSTAMVFGLGWGAAGARIGAVALSWIPIVGPLLGGFIGGTIGYMAGSKVGETIYKGVKIVRKAVKNVYSSTWNAIKSSGNKIKNFLFG